MFSCDPARLNGDESAETQQLLQQFNVLEVPTFLFFKNGKEVTRHVGSSRGDLIGKILQVSSWQVQQQWQQQLWQQHW